jgi:hypothetical protein
MASAKGLRLGETLFDEGKKRLAWRPSTKA